MNVGEEARLHVAYVKYAVKLQLYGTKPPTRAHALRTLICHGPGKTAMLERCKRDSPGS